MTITHPPARRHLWQGFVAALALALVVQVVAVVSAARAAAADITLLNVSYDPTREFYTEFNALFAAHWKAKTGDTVTVQQSHGGAGKQARAVIDGLAADVVTLALQTDIDSLHDKAKLIPKDWRDRLPLKSTPYTSTIVLVVRAGNPKGIKDWNDLVRPGIRVITPDPKTSGGARYNYLAAWGYAQRANGGDEEKTKDFVAALYRNVPVKDSGARGSTVTFTERGIGDVFISWENEALLLQEKYGKDKYPIVYPSISILAEPPVAIVDRVVDKKGTRAIAQAYLEFLYTPQAQLLIGKHHFRPTEAAAIETWKDRFPAIPLLTLDKDFGGFPAAVAKHFAEGGVYDSLADR